MRRAVLLVVVIGLGVVTISSAARDNANPQQDVIRLEQRMNQLEQRLFSMDTTLRNIEQQSRLAGAGRRGVAEEEVVQPPNKTGSAGCERSGDYFFDR